MGAVFALMPVLPFLSLHRDRPECVRKCARCTKSCPANIELPTDGSMAVSGDCFQCGKCIGQCPVENIHAGLHSDGPAKKTPFPASAEMSSGFHCFMPAFWRYCWCGREHKNIGKRKGTAAGRILQQSLIFSVRYFFQAHRLSSVRDVH